MIGSIKSEINCKTIKLYDVIDCLSIPELIRLANTGAMIDIDNGEVRRIHMEIQHGRDIDEVKRAQKIQIDALIKELISQQKDNRELKAELERRQFPNDTQSNLFGEVSEWR